MNFQLIPHGTRMEANGHGAPFDIEDVFWSHRGERCTFDTMLDELGLVSEPLARLAAIVRGADTARLHLTPEAPGLAAALPPGKPLADAVRRRCPQTVPRFVRTERRPPAGVGAFRDPQRFLEDGDEIAIEIEGLGTLVNPVRREAP